MSDSGDKWYAIWFRIVECHGFVDEFEVLDTVCGTQASVDAYIAEHKKDDGDGSIEYVYTIIPRPGEPKAVIPGGLS